MAIAFFDLDKTLLAVNSGTLWLKREVKLGHISRLQAALGAVWLVRYHLGFTAIEEALVRAIRQLEGTPAREVRARTERFYLEEVRGLVRPGARAALEAHRRQGDRLVLLTSSSDYLADLVAHDLALDGVLCTRFEVAPDGCHTGRTLGELCYGVGKRRHAERMAADAGLRLADCTFYTDSYADLPVLEAVGRPVTVHPDPRLRREAGRRGWPVVNWGIPLVDPLPPPAAAAGG